jgi:hypothetical protein
MAGAEDSCNQEGGAERLGGEAIALRNCQAVATPGPPSSKSYLSRPLGILETRTLNMARIALTRINLFAPLTQ